MDYPSASCFPPLDELRAVAERVGRDHGCRLIVLFGSTARGEARAADLDIAALCDTPLDLVALTNRLIRELGRQEVDVCDLRRAEPLLMALVARDGIPLFESQPGEFDRFFSLAMRRYADTRKFREMERQGIPDILARLRAS